ncbi:acyl-CoA thioesterase [Parvibaculum sp.]|uniref:acyl-CoA thioesterase n=1 Tax=Parvibaculum sp. TaxID=2024848 RepID=UPI00272F1B26|nr:acyl-CoA thioesterase [Parvibaculum sp.]MDP1626667.1 hotdog domain-containing protein [Parvibaculum sp.]MDP2150588.1 hotdog domain-containing protein [Parvibaculum sp.]MDP3330056.1 hotdog domain-containing protein [Parvibaculum sp.]
MEDLLAVCAPARLPATPFTRLAELVFPEQTNHHGTLFGGASLALMDRAAYIAATRLTRRKMVTAGFDGVEFGRPVLPGELAEVTATVRKTGRSSVVFDVELLAENLLTGEQERAVAGTIAMVAQGKHDDEPLPMLVASPAPQPGLTSFVEVVFPDAANHRDILFGGNALAMMGKAAFIAATRHCHQTVVMAASERIDFRAPVKVGAFADVTARIVMTGRSSICVEVELVAEEALSGERELSARGRFVMVAIGANGRPVAVPPRAA